MIKKLAKLFIISLITISGLCLFASVPVENATAAGPSNICETNNIPDDVKAASGCNGNSDDGGKDIGDSILSILNSIILVAGIIAVIYIIVGGTQYMTSGGDPGKVKKAKDTILYACIGLAVSVLAFAIVNFTIGIISRNNGGGNNDDENEEESLIITEKDIAFLKEKL